MNKIDIGRIELKGLLKSCSNIQIPFFQRQYTWEAKHIETLLENIYDSEASEYFLGSIILKNEGTKNIIIDGQQRISTILLIYKVVLNTYKSKDNDYIVLKDLYKEMKFDSKNLEDGSQLLDIIKGDNGDIKLSQNSTNYLKNYNIINKFISDKQRENVDAAKKLYYQLEKVVLARVIVVNVDEHMLFSQINSTGKELSAFDLIKNYLFSHLSNRLQDDSEKDSKIKEKMKRFNIASDLKSKDDIFRHFIGSQTGKLPKRESKIIYNEFAILHKTKYSQNIEEMFNDLHVFFVYYKFLETKEWRNTKYNCLYPTLNSLIDSFNTYAIVLITIFTKNSELNHGKINISSEQFSIIENCLLILESYKFKRDFCLWSNANQVVTFIPRLSLDLVNSIFNNYKTDIVLYFLLIYRNLRDKKYRMPTDDEFLDGMYKASMFSKKPVVKSFLYRISIMEYKVTPRLEDLINEVSIDHILPQSLTKWREAGYNEDEKDVDLKLHTIGNLTLTPNNSAYSNEVFKNKQEKMNSNNDVVFPLNKYLLKPEMVEWNIKEIDKRAKWLFDICQKKWNFDKYKKEILILINKNEEVFSSFDDKDN
ncbi:MAG: DUF262 domain-containing protein [Metamycoplasmataceae bacterium]